MQKGKFYWEYHRSVTQGRRGFVLQQQKFDPFVSGSLAFIWHVIPHITKCGFSCALHRISNINIYDSIPFTWPGKIKITFPKFFFNFYSNLMNNLEPKLQWFMIFVTEIIRFHSIRVVLIKRLVKHPPPIN